MEEQGSLRTPSRTLQNLRGCDMLYNKFLRKRANSALDNLSKDDYMHAANIFGINAKKLLDKEYIANQRQRIGNFYNAANRLKDYQAGNHADDYDPHQDMATVTNMWNSPGFADRVNKFTSAYPEHRWSGQFKSLGRNIGAMQSAIANPEHFKALNAARGMGLMDFLFDSYENNYKLMQAVNGPMGAWLNNDQRNMVRNNWGLMKLIWRIKKFFGEFGNWKYREDPENTTLRTTPIPSGVVPKTPQTTAQSTSTSTTGQQSVQSRPAAQKPGATTPKTRIPLQHQNQ